MGATEKLTIFILNYNEKRNIERGSILSIKKAIDRIENIDVSVVCLDNLSSDKSPEMIKEIIPDAVIASTFRNEGYVRGTNIGLQLSWKMFKPDYFILVDSDNFTEENAYNELVTYARNHPEVAMVQPIVKSSTDRNKIISCGHVFNERGGTDSITDINGDNDIEDLESCSISSTLVRSDALERIGLLNESFVMYYESSDISFRFRKAGYKCACCKKAVAYNERLSTTRLSDFNKYYLMRRNLFLLWYIHDTEKYHHYLNVWKSIRDELQNDYGKEDFITDYMREAERRALCEAYMLQREEVKNYISIPDLNEFSKDDVCILSYGR